LFGAAKSPTVSALRAGDPTEKSGLSPLQKKKNGGGKKENKRLGFSGGARFGSAKTNGGAWGQGCARQQLASK